MRIVKDKQLIEDIHDYDVILFGMGINNAMNKGFSYDVSLNFPEVRISENLTGYGDLRKYGKVHETKTDDGVIFCACYCYNQGLKRKSNNVYLEYDSLEQCLNEAYKKYKNKRIACPIIGQDKYDGDGDKNIILEIFHRIFPDECDITLYDFVQQDFKMERYKDAVLARKRYTEGEITKDEFKHLKKTNEWKRLNGIFKEMPDEFEYKPRKKTRNKIIVAKK